MKNFKRKILRHFIPQDDNTEIVLRQPLLRALPLLVDVDVGLALHELCHLKTRTHGKEFITLMDRFMPDWREVRKRLNDSPLDYVSGEKAKDGEAT